MICIFDMLQDAFIREMEWNQHLLKANPDYLSIKSWHYF